MGDLRDWDHYEGYWTEVGKTAKGFFWTGPKRLVIGLHPLVQIYRAGEGLCFAGRGVYRAITDPETSRAEQEAQAAEKESKPGMLGA